MLKVSKGTSNSPGLSIVHSDNMKTLFPGSYNIQTWSPLTSYFPAPMLVCLVSSNRLSMSKPCLHYKYCLVQWFCCLRELSAMHFHPHDFLCTLTAPSVWLKFLQQHQARNVFIFIFFLCYTEYNWLISYPFYNYKVDIFIMIHFSDTVVEKILEATNYSLFKVCKSS